MRYSVETDYKLFLRNLKQYKWVAALLFALLTLAILTVGFFMPKTYWSYSQLIIGGQQLHVPLGDNNNQAAGTDWAKVAKEFVYSRKNLIDLMRELEYIEDDIETQSDESRLARIKANTTVELSGNDNLLKIGFKDSDPEFARSIAMKLTDLFIENIHGYRTEETAEAFDFIHSQVEEYKQKLVAAEEELKNFKTQKLEKGASSEEAVSRRLESLQQTLDTARLDLQEALIRKASLERQLTGEVAETVSLARRSQHVGRLQVLNDELSKLRLSYHEGYPEIQNIKYQIADTHRQIELEKNNSSNSVIGVEDGFKTNKLYQDLKLQLSEVRTRIATLQTRIKETESNITRERAKGEVVHQTDARLSELSRDYEVNRGLYEKLLKSRESARVSKEIDEQKRGMNVKVYEPAFVPVNPSGLRFLHFLAAGLFFGLAVPITLIYFYQLVDSKIKSPELIASKFDVPVLGATTAILNRKDIAAIKGRNILWKLFVMASIILIAAIGLTKLVSA